jgi:hypothetical protein
MEAIKIQNHYRVLSDEISGKVHLYIVIIAQEQPQSGDLGIEALAIISTNEEAAKKEALIGKDGMGIIFVFNLNTLIHDLREKMNTEKDKWLTNTIL